MMDFKLAEQIRVWLDEDIGTGDITAVSTVSADRIAEGKFIAKESGMICGMDVCKTVFLTVDPSVEFRSFAKDGDRVNKGDVIAAVGGNARALLMAERLSLNLLQRMSGIATKTNEAVKQVQGTNAKIADTRKTTPGLRVLEKYAVKVGGGSNHRFNLADGVLIKDNHIVASGSITNAVKAAKENAPHTLKVEVEVETLAQLREALDVKADIIMLDNMDYETMSEAVRMVNGRALTEASGNMGEKDLLAVARTGVDIISIGALTHTVRAMDISLKFAMK